MYLHYSIIFLGLLISIFSYISLTKLSNENMNMKRSKRNCYITISLGIIIILLGSLDLFKVVEIPRKIFLIMIGFLGLASTLITIFENYPKGYSKIVVMICGIIIIGITVYVWSRPITEFHSGMPEATKKLREQRDKILNLQQQARKISSDYKQKQAELRQKYQSRNSHRVPKSSSKTEEILKNAPSVPTKKIEEPQCTPCAGSTSRSIYEIPSDVENEDLSELLEEENEDVNYSELDELLEEENEDNDFQEIMANIKDLKNRQNNEKELSAEELEELYQGLAELD